MILSFVCRCWSRLGRVAILAAVVLSNSASNFAREKPTPGMYESYNGFTIPASPVLPAHEIHPSLWFTAADLPALQARLSADEFMRTRWAAVQADAPLDASLPAAPDAHAKTEAIHRYYGAMSIAARAHALVSLLADNAADRAAHRARAIELLLRAYDGPIFELDSKVQGSAVDEIYRATWLQNYAHAYDCVAASLPAEVDRRIRARLAREAQCVYDHLYRWTPTSPHNHLSKPAWGLASMALTLSAEPEAKAWLARALEASNKNTRYFFSGDGLYREGSHYLIYSLINFLPFLYHYRNVSGVDDFPEFQPVFEAMVEARNSRGWLPNIADSYLRPTPTHLAAAGYRQAKTKLNSSVPLAEVLMWSYRACDLAPFDEERAKSGMNYTGATGDYPLEIDELLTYDPTIKATPPDAAPNIFLAGGQSYFRTGWTRQGDGERYLLFRGMASADNHQHDDHLSFILEAEGQLMCSDSGYSRGTYTGTERKGWYATAPAHNTITFDGRPAKDAAVNQTPPSLFRVDEPGLVGEEKEAYFASKATWRRAIFWLGGDYYVVCDRVSAPKPGAIVATLHGGRGQLTGTGSERTWTYDRDRYGRAAQLHAWIGAPGADVSVKQGELTYIKGDYAAFPYLEINTTAAHCAWLTVLKPAAADERAGFRVNSLAVDGATAASIESGDQRCVVVSQTDPGQPRDVGGVETDGAFALVRTSRAGKVLGYVVLEGTRLSYEGRQLWHAAERTNVARVPIN